MLKKIVRSMIVVGGCCLIAIGIIELVKGGMHGANAKRAIIPQIAGFFSVLFGAIAIKEGWDYIFPSNGRVEKVSIVISTLAIVSILIFWAPLFGLVFASLSLWLTRNIQGWQRIVSRIALLLSVLFTLITLLLIILDALNLLR